jgi:hypothetical protein
MTGTASSAPAESLRILPWYVFALVLIGLLPLVALFASATGSQTTVPTGVRIAEAMGLALAGGLLSWGWVYLLLRLGDGRPAVCMAILFCFLCSAMVLIAAGMSLIWARSSWRCRIVCGAIGVVLAIVCLCIPARGFLAIGLMLLASLLIPIVIHLIQGLRALGAPAGIAPRARHLATSPSALAMTALLMGMFAGMLDGTWNVIPAGYLPHFLLDKTWGLSGTANGCTVHLYNLWTPNVLHITSHTPGLPQAVAAVVGQGGHQYSNGFFFTSSAAFTQGNVSTNLSTADSVAVGTINPTTVTHESEHIAQNRIFGPLFTLLYVAWLIVMAVPGAIAGCMVGYLAAFSIPWFIVNLLSVTLCVAITPVRWAIRKWFALALVISIIVTVCARSAILTAGTAGAMAFAYASNPFEVWAYDSNNQTARHILVDNLDPGAQSLLWLDPLAVVGGVVFLILGLLAVWQLILGVWLQRAWWIPRAAPAGGRLAQLPPVTRALQWALLAANATLNSCTWMAMAAVDPNPAANNAPDGDHLSAFGIAMAVVVALLGLLPGLRACAGNRVVQEIIRWSSLLMPTCWFGLVLAALLWWLNSLFLVDWALQGLGLTSWGATETEAAEAHDASAVVSRQCVLGWCGAPAVFCCAWFGALAPALFGAAGDVLPVVRKRLRGHQLNHAAYGLFALGRLAEEPARSFWEGMAESTVGIGERQRMSREQGPDQLRVPMWCTDAVVVLPG